MLIVNIIQSIIIRLNQKITASDIFYLLTMKMQFFRHHQKTNSKQTHTPSHMCTCTHVSTYQEYVARFINSCWQKSFGRKRENISCLYYSYVPFTAYDIFIAYYLIFTQNNILLTWCCSLGKWDGQCKQIPNKCTAHEMEETNHLISLILLNFVDLKYPFSSYYNSFCCNIMQLFHHEFR